MSDWKNVQYKDGKMRTSEGGGGGGSSTFAGLDDVSFNNVQNGQVPKYNSETHKWENTNESGGGHNYSTTEHVIGTWIDGKPLYERSFTKTLASSPDADTSSFLVASNITGIETLVKMEGTIKAASAYAFAPVCGLPVQVGWNYAFHINPTNQLVVWTSNAYANYSQIAGGTAICTLRYTKTTD